MRYPSRSALKLLSGLEYFRKEIPVEITGRVCLDLGCAHGGFVQVLLEEGARCVYAVDVAYGMLDYKLRQDPRVVVCERLNLRRLSKSWFRAEDWQYLSEIGRSGENKRTTGGIFCTCDVSFISARTVLETLMLFIRQTQIPLLEALLLIKPQFEDSQSTKKGVIRDSKLRENLVSKVEKKAQELGFECMGTTPVQPKGAQGNQEYMMYVQAKLLCLVTKKSLSFDK